MTYKKILLLVAFIIYFGSIITVNLNAADSAREIWEGGDKGGGVVLRDPFISIMDIINIKEGMNGQKTKDPLDEIPLFPMALKGVMLQEFNSVAIINEEIIREGQIWHDFKIESIDSQGVTFSYMGKILRLTMREGVIPQEELEAEEKNQNGNRYNSSIQDVPEATGTRAPEDSYEYEE